MDRLKTILFFLILCLCFISAKESKAFGECDEFGTMVTYDTFTNSCSCMSGYSFGQGYSGQTMCISDNQLCKDEYGYNTMSNYAGNCECLSGYGFGTDYSGKTQCISLDSMCKDELGYNSSYSYLHNTCQCSYGYIIENGNCVDADSYCHNEHGYYSSYDSLSNSCECDDGYTMDEYSECVEKQNNVYFTLVEIDTDNRQAIIENDYSYSRYLISYNSGCYSSSFNRYINKQIVVNLGTDFYLDTWDRIVLQDDDEVCDITYRELVDSDYTLEIEEEIDWLTEEQIIALSESIDESGMNDEQYTINTPETYPEPLENEKITNIISEADSVSEPVEVKERWYKRFFKWLF